MGRADRLPARVMAGQASTAECSLWRVCYDNKLHELLTGEVALNQQTQASFVCAAARCCARC